MDNQLIIFDMQAQLCQSLSSPIRLRIIHSLKEGAKSVNDIAALLAISQPTISRHLSVLRSTGLLASHRRGTEVFYEITNPKVVEVCEMMRAILAERQSKQLEFLQRIHV